MLKLPALAFVPRIRHASLLKRATQRCHSDKGRGRYFRRLTLDGLTADKELDGESKYALKDTDSNVPGENSLNVTDGQIRPLDEQSRVPQREPLELLPQQEHNRRPAEARAAWKEQRLFLNPPALDPPGQVLPAVNVAKDQPPCGRHKTFTAARGGLIPRASKARNRAAQEERQALGTKDREAIRDKSRQNEVIFKHMPGYPLRVSEGTSKEEEKVLNSKRTVSLLEELFGTTESRAVKNVEVKQDREIPIIALDYLIPSVDVTGTVPNHVAGQQQPLAFGDRKQNRSIAVLVLYNASKHLVESDFRRAIPSSMGHNWTRNGDILKGQSNLPTRSTHD